MIDWVRWLAQMLVAQIFVSTRVKQNTTRVVAVMFVSWASRLTILEIGRFLGGKRTPQVWVEVFFCFLLFFQAAITYFRMYIKQLSFAVSWKSAPTFLLTRVVTQFLLTYKRRLCHICRFRSLSVVALANFFVVGPCNGFEICVFAAFSFQRLYLIVTCIPTVQF